jgi:hypothetical protein
MATWIAHLRSAEMLLKILPGLSSSNFAIGILFLIQVSLMRNGRNSTHLENYYTSNTRILSSGEQQI